MKKKEILISISIISGAIVLALILSLSGGFLFKGRRGITEFKAYKDLPASATKIELIIHDAENNTTGDEADEDNDAETNIKVVEVTNQSDKENIIKILLERVYKRGKKQPEYVGGIELKIYDEKGKIWIMHSKEIKGDNGYYYHTKNTTELDNILNGYLSK